MAASTPGTRAGAGKQATKKASPKKRKAPAKAAPAEARRPSRAERAEAKRRERIKRMRARAGSRYRIHYDIEGPRVRLGMAWFAGAVVAFLLGMVGVGLYFGLAFSAAGSHALRTWRARGAAVDPRVALLGVAVVIAGAAVHPKVMGVAILAVTAVVVGLAAREGGDGSAGAAGRASLVLQCTLAPGVAGGCFVLLFDLEPWAAVALVLLASAYETGDFLIGSGATNSYEGPLAGAVAVLVGSLAVAALGFPPFDVGEAALFGILVAPAAFAGQLLASVVLPHARALAPAIRRVDSLLIAAPLWYVGIDVFIA